MKSVNKKAAMEMSMGTIVTIVLLMSVLVLGLILIRSIFIGGSDAVKSINKEVETKIGEIFNSDEKTKIAIFPPSRLIKIKKGNDVDLGFAFSVRNVETTAGKFTYTVTSDGVNRADCKVTSRDAQSWISAGDVGSVNIAPGSMMENVEFVRFRVPDDAPPCLVRYFINVKKDGVQYGSTASVDVEIKGT